jgi:hypothetical protein
MWYRIPTETANVFDLEPGDAIRIDPAETRQIHNGDAASRLILAGANR